MVHAASSSTERGGGATCSICWSHYQDKLNLVCRIFNSTFKARPFYAHLLNCEASDDFAYYKNTLIDKIKNTFKIAQRFFTAFMQNCIISQFFRQKFNSDFKYVNCVNHGICDGVKTVLFTNQFLKYDDLDTHGRLLRSF